MNDAQMTDDGKRSWLDDIQHGIYDSVIDMAFDNAQAAVELQNRERQARIAEDEARKANGAIRSTGRNFAVGVATGGRRLPQMPSQMSGGGYDMEFM